MTAKCQKLMPRKSVAAPPKLPMKSAKLNIKMRRFRIFEGRISQRKVDFRKNGKTFDLRKNQKKNSTS